MKTILLLLGLLSLMAFFSCAKEESCTNNYKGKWAFTTNYSTNNKPVHTTEDYVGKVSVLNNDSIHVYYGASADYPIKVDCSTGTLKGDIYQGNHGSGHYTGTISGASFKLTMVRIGGFPPYDTSYQIISGVKL